LYTQYHAEPSLAQITTCHYGFTHMSQDGRPQLMKKTISQINISKDGRLEQ
jgi:hypothetical protein